MTDEEIGQKAKKTATCKTVERLRRVGLTRSYTYTKLKSLCEAQKFEYRDTDVMVEKYKKLAEVARR